MSPVAEKGIFLGWDESTTNGTIVGLIPEGFELLEVPVSEIVTSTTVKCTEEEFPLIRWSRLRGVKDAAKILDDIADAGQDGGAVTVDAVPPPTPRFGGSEAGPAPSGSGGVGLTSTPSGSGGVGAPSSSSSASSPKSMSTNCWSSS